MDRVLQYNFGYLPPRVGRASDAPLASLATDILGNQHKNKKQKYNSTNNTAHANKKDLSLKQALDEGAGDEGGAVSEAPTVEFL